MPRAGCSAGRSSWSTTTTRATRRPCRAIYTKLLDVDKVELVVGAYAHQHDRAGDADRDPEEEDVHRPVRARGQHRVQLSELLRDDPVRAGRRSRRSPRASSTSPWRRTRSRRRWPSWRRTRNSRATPPTAPARTPRRRACTSSMTRPIRRRPTDFTPIVRAIQATNPDLVVVCSYPPDSVGIVRAVNEVGLKPKLIGGGMVGLQATAIKTQLGPLLNGIINYDFWLPVPKMDFAGVGDLMKQYQASAGAEGVDPLGYYLPPWGYAQLQVLQQAVEGNQEPRRRQARRLHPRQHVQDRRRRREVRHQAANGRSRACWRSSSRTSRATTSPSSRTCPHRSWWRRPSTNPAR